jgi:hypothetical protein
MHGLTGRCGCDGVRWRAVVSPFRSVLCHCASCRQATDAPVAGYLGFGKAAVRWSGVRAFRTTSPGVTRGACPACGTALSYMCTRWPGELYLHAASMDDPSAFAPEAHVYWAERVAGSVPGDALPKHAGRGPADLDTRR